MINLVTENTESLELDWFCKDWIEIREEIRKSLFFGNLFFGIESNFEMLKVIKLVDLLADFIQRVR